MSDPLSRPYRPDIAERNAVGQQARPTIRAQATIMGYADSCALIGAILLIAVVAVAMLQKAASAAGAAH